MTVIRVIAFVAALALFPLLVVLYVRLDHNTAEEYQERIEVLIDDLTLPLHRAAKQGDSEKVADIIESGRNIEETDKDGRTPLHLAAESGSIEVAITLIAVGAKLEAQDEVEGFTPLHLAASNGHEDVVRMLLKYGADVKGESYNEIPPLHSAATHGHLDAVRLLHEHGGSVHGINEDGSGVNPLYAAAYGGHVEVVEYLIDSGADPDVLLKNFTPLSGAAISGDVETVNMLLSAGANVNGVVDGEQLFPPIYLAARWDRPDAVKALIEAGADVDAQGFGGFTALNISAAHNHIEVLKILLASGADGNNDDNDFSASPIDTAVSYRKHEAVSLIMSAGFSADRKMSLDYDEIDIDGLLRAPRRLSSLDPVVSVLNINQSGLADKRTSPLYYAITHRDIRTLAALLEGGADVDYRHAYEATPLHLEVNRANNHRPIQMLIKHGANTNSKDSTGSTPLHYAAFWGYKDTVEDLIEAGADVNLENIVGKTPLDYAECLGHSSTYELLLESGAVPGVSTVYLTDDVCNAVLGTQPTWAWKIEGLVFPFLDEFAWKDHER